MNEYLQNEDDISLSYRDICLHATGKNAELISFGIFSMFLLIGIAILLKNS